MGSIQTRHNIIFAEFSLPFPMYTLVGNVANFVLFRETLNPENRGISSDNSIPTSILVCFKNENSILSLFPLF